MTESDHIQTLSLSLPWSLWWCSNFPWGPNYFYFPKEFLFLNTFSFSFSFLLWYRFFSDLNSLSTFIRRCLAKHTGNYLPSTNSPLISSLLNEPWIRQVSISPPHTYVSQGKRIHLWSWICLAYIIPLLLPGTDSKLGIFWLMTCKGKVCWGLEEYFPFPNRKLEEALFLLVIYMSRLDAWSGNHLATNLKMNWKGKMAQ